MGLEKHQEAGTPASLGASAAGPCPASRLWAFSPGFAPKGSIDGVWVGCVAGVCTYFSLVGMVESHFLLPMLQPDLLSHAWLGFGAGGWLEPGILQHRGFACPPRVCSQLFPVQIHTHYPSPSEAEGGSQEMLFVPRGSWEMDVAGSSGIRFLVAH